VKKKKYDRLKKECFEYLREVYAPEERIFVFGEGNLDARILLVGEAPGAEETVQQRPFVGRAGKNLDGFIVTLGVSREDMYVTNVVKFRPVKRNESTGRLSNRPPTRQEVSLCMPFLMREIELVRPGVVVSLGNTALQALSGDIRTSIGRVHGQPAEMTLSSGVRTALFPLYHPASIIYNRKLAAIYEEDLLKLGALVRENGLL
jgi:uracil-DNA glycosylase family 4